MTRVRHTMLAVSLLVVLTGCDSSTSGHPGSTPRGTYVAPPASDIPIPLDTGCYRDTVPDPRLTPRKGAPGETVAARPSPCATPQPTLPESNG